VKPPQPNLGLASRTVEIRAQPGGQGCGGLWRRSDFPGPDPIQERGVGDGNRLGSSARPAGEQHQRGVVALALASSSPPFEFHSAEGVIYTRMRNLPPSRVEAAVLDRVIVSDGCVIQSGTQIERSIVGVRSQVGKNVRFRDVVMIGADHYESDEPELALDAVHPLPPIGVGDGTLIERAILDKDCRIGRDVRIVNAKKQDEAEGENFVIRDGIVVIPKGAVVRDGEVI
jgi:glucose-1-phosphate adenylyltransferase